MVEGRGESDYYMTTWEHEITEQRRVMGDDTPILAAAWRDLDKSGKPSTGPTMLWERDDDKDALNAFLQRRFESWHGYIEGVPFVVWTEKSAYFAVKYDGAEWVGAVPLTPTTDFEPTHFGG